MRLLPACFFAVTVLAAADDHATPASARDAPAARKITADTALEWLKFGNERHVAGKPVHWHQSLERLRQVAKEQHPHAVVLSCADSRVPPEIVFDQGLGDLFVVRVAGNVAGEKELASIEYAAGHLHTPLVGVMGHQRCGALQAAVSGGEAPGHIGSLISSLTAAVARVRGTAGDTVDQAVHSNVRMVTEQLRESEPVLHHLVKDGKLKIVGAYYSLDTGEVRWLDPR